MIVFFGIALALVILVIVIWMLLARKLREKYAVMWLVIGLAVLILGVFPQLLLWLTDTLGVQVPANLLFSLAIYDTLTPGSLTGDQIVAGTGTIDEKGKVGPIGGIQQKIVGARDDGAVLFLVPPDNCDDALGARNGDMRLVKAVTMHAAAQAIEKWVKNPDAKLPTCASTTERTAVG